MLVSQLYESYNNNMVAYAKERERLVKRIENAKNRLSKHEKTYPHWTTIVKIICDSICEKEHLHYSGDLYTFGMRAECPVSFKNDNNEIVGRIVFTPNGSSASDYFTIHYDTGKKLEGYQKGSIGELNGFDNITAPLPETIEEIIEKCLYKRG